MRNLLPVIILILFSAMSQAADDNETVFGRKQGSGGEIAPAPRSYKVTITAPEAIPECAESAFSNKQWWSEQWNSSYSFFEDGTIWEVWGNSPKFGTWKPTSPTSCNISIDNHNFELSEDKKSIRRVGQYPGTWVQVESAPASLADVGGFKWMPGRNSGTGSSVLEFFANGTVYCYDEGKESQGTWKYLGKGIYGVRFSIPAQVITTFTLSSDKQSLKQRDKRTWTRPDTAPSPARPTVALPSQLPPACEGSPFAGTRWQKGDSIYEFLPDGTWSEEWGGSKKSGTWEPVAVNTIKTDIPLAFDAVIMSRSGDRWYFYISKDKNTIARFMAADARNAWDKWSRLPGAPAISPHLVEFLKLKKEYQQALNDAIASTNTADSNRLNNLQRSATRNGDVEAVEKIKVAIKAVEAGKSFEIEGTAKKTASSEETELQKIKKNRDMVVQKAKRNAASRIAASGKKLLSATLQAKDIQTARKVELFMFTAEGVQEGMFIGKWQPEGSRDTMEFKKNNTVLWNGDGDGTWKLIEDGVARTNRHNKTYTITLIGKDAVTDGERNYQRVK